jgi:K+-sensing histidine kinase KdpD
MVSILLISKNEELIKKVSNFCENKNYNFLIAENKIEAENLLEQENIHIVIVSSDSIADPMDFINVNAIKANKTLFILVSDKVYGSVRTIIENGYYDYIAVDAGDDILFDSLVNAVRNVLTNNDKVTSERKENKRLKSYVSLMNLVDTFVKEVNSEKDLKGLINVLFSYLEKYFKDRVILLTLIDDMKEYVAYSYGVSMDKVKNLRWNLSNSTSLPWTENILNNKESILIDNPLKDPIYSKSDIANIFPEGLIKLPLYTSNYVVGSIMISLNKKNKSFSQEEEIFLNLIREHVAIAIDNINLNKKLNEAQVQIIENERIATMAKFAVSVNHEINNPLCAISLNIELLKRRLGDENINDIIDAIEQNIEKINSITNKISNLKKINIKEYLPGIDMIDLENSE